MIRRLEPDDIAQILQMEDNNLERVLACEKGEFVQWLMSNVNNERLLILGRVEANKLISYCAVVNTMFPPICTVVSMLYMSNLVIGDNEIKEAILIWGRDIEAKAVIFQCGDTDTLAKMNGEQIAIVGSWKI